MPARPVWNQFGYNVINVNKDLTIPDVQFNPATLFNNGKRPFNAYRQQATLLNQDGDSYDAVSAPVLRVTNPDTVCSPLTVDLTDAEITEGSTLGLTYTYWTNGATPIELSILDVSAVSESDTFLIVGTNDEGCSASASVIKEVNQQPSLSINNPNAVCQPATVDITDELVTAGSSADLEYSYWENETATFPLEVSPDAILETGTYYIKATDANACFNIKPVAVEVNQQPVLNITHPSAVCEPSLVDVSASIVDANYDETNIYTYFEDALASTPIEDATLISESGIYYIQAQSAAGCIAIAPVEVTMYAAPVVSVVSDQSLVCVGSEAVLTASGATSYLWSISAVGDVINVTPTENTTYAVEGTDVNGCTAIASVDVSVEDCTPTNGCEVTVGEDITVCKGESYQLVASTVNCDDCEVEDKKPDCQSKKDKKSRYGIKSYEKKSCGSKSYSNKKTVSKSSYKSDKYSSKKSSGYKSESKSSCNDKYNSNKSSKSSSKSSCVPKVSRFRCAKVDEPVSNPTSDCITYEWSPSAGLLNANTATPTIINPYKTTTYTVVVTDANGNVATDAITVKVKRCKSCYRSASVEVGDEEVLASVDLQIYPNPILTEGSISYSIPAEETANMSIYSQTGVLVKSYDDLEADGTIKVSSFEYASGLYICVLDGNNGSAITKKFTVK